MVDGLRRRAAASGMTMRLLMVVLALLAGPAGAQYSNPAVDAALDRARTELDAGVRSGLIAEAQRLALAEFAVVPTQYQVNVWASRRGIVVPARMDEMTLAAEIRPAGP